MLGDESLGSYGGVDAYNNISSYLHNLVYRDKNIATYFGPPIKDITAIDFPMKNTR